MVQTWSGINVKHPPQGLQPKALSRKQAKRLLKQQQFVGVPVDHVLKVRKARKVQKQIQKQERTARANRLQEEILGSDRKFPGTILIPDPEVARAQDKERLKDIEVHIAQGTAIVYWADGSLSNAGYLGAGVAWRGPSNFWYQTYHMGRHTGDSSDAELFAIAAALGRTRKAVNGSTQIQLVRIYTDAQTILHALATGNHAKLGPMINTKTALQGVYERAEWLVAQDIKLELIWVKGHAGSEGNKWADQAASQAVREQIEPSQQGNKRPGKRQSLMTAGDIPDMFNEKGPDWADEWLLRANAHIFQKSAAQGLGWTAVHEADATMVQQANATIPQYATAMSVQETNVAAVQDSHATEAADGSRDRPFVLD